MDAFDLLFGPIPDALCAMFEYGVLPREEDFLELTPEQYRKYIETFGDTGEKVFMLVSHNPSRTIGDDYDIMCLTESQKNGFMDAVALVERYCESKEFTTDEQKLRYAASKLPEPFSKGTEYAVCHKYKIVKGTSPALKKMKHENTSHVSHAQM